MSVYIRHTNHRKIICKIEKADTSIQNIYITLEKYILLLHTLKLICINTTLSL